MSVQSRQGCILNAAGNGSVVASGLIVVDSGLNKADSGILEATSGYIEADSGLMEIAGCLIDAATGFMDGAIHVSIAAQAQQTSQRAVKKRNGAEAERRKQMR